jgi:hypothetical protein
VNTTDPVEHGKCFDRQLHYGIPNPKLGSHARF